MYQSPGFNSFHDFPHPCLLWAKFAPLVSQQPPIAQAGLKLTIQPRMTLRVQTQVAMSGYIVLLLSFNDTLVDQ